MIKPAYISFAVALLVSFIVYFVPTSPVAAQSAVEAHCGDVIRGEFTENGEFNYEVSVSTGTIIEFFVKPADSYLATGLRLQNSQGASLDILQQTREPKIISGLLSKGVYTLVVVNSPGLLGEFELWISCTLPDGTSIPAGSKAPTPSESTELPRVETDTTTSIKATTSVTETRSSVQPLVEIGKSYEFEYGTKTKLMKVLEVRADGWIKVEHDETWSWLNLTHVVLITPVEE